MFLPVGIRHRLLQIVAFALFVSSISLLFFSNSDANAKTPRHLATITCQGEEEPDAIVWGKTINGLAVGIGEVRTSLKSPLHPVVDMYLENRGTVPLDGIILSRSQFILELDGKFYAERGREGLFGPTPPGERYGPIEVATVYFHQQDDLQPESYFDQTAPEPVLTAGDHTMRLHYVKMEGYFFLPPPPESADKVPKGVKLYASATVEFSTAISPYPVDDAVAMVVRELKDSNRDIRRNAATAAGKLRLLDSKDALIEACDDEDVDVRVNAASSLGKLGDTTAIQALRDLLEAPDMRLRFAAVDSLVKLGEPLEPSWIEPIIKSKHYVYQNAIWLVRRHGGEHGASALIRCLDAEDPSVSSYYNMVLVSGIWDCGGPQLRYHHGFDEKGTPERVEDNRRVLSELQAWLPD